MFTKKQKNSKNTFNELLIYGKHAVICALSNPKRKIKRLYTTKVIWDELKNKYSHLKMPVNILQAAELNNIAPANSNHQNIILITEPLEQPELEDILINSSQNKVSCILILDQVTDPHNIGAIIRSAAAFSADAVILPYNNSPKENNSILKSAAGACETVPMINVVNITNCIKTLKEEGYWIIGLDGHTDTTLSNSVFASKVAIILGSEDSGMRKLTKMNCDHIVKISISDRLESLNVSNAAAIALYEFSQYANSIREN
jgi:23S rRNA (guanosine2251-2'-O)-methyltransferase